MSNLNIIMSIIKSIYISLLRLIRQCDLITTDPQNKRDSNQTLQRRQASSQPTSGTGLVHGKSESLLCMWKRNASTCCLLYRLCTHLAINFDLWDSSIFLLAWDKSFILFGNLCSKSCSYNLKHETTHLKP